MMKLFTKGWLSSKEKIIISGIAIISLGIAIDSSYPIVKDHTCNFGKHITNFNTSVLNTPYTPHTHCSEVDRMNRVNDTLTLLYGLPKGLPINPDLSDINTLCDALLKTAPGKIMKPDDCIVKILSYYATQPESKAFQTLESTLQINHDNKPDKTLITQKTHIIFEKSHPLYLENLPPLILQNIEVSQNDKKEKSD